jgi:hypothetical protein
MELTPAEAEETAPDRYPFRDLRLWAGTALCVALAALADMAWTALAPGRAAPVVAVGAAAAVVAAGNLGLALHPRARRFIAARQVPPPVLPLVGAVACVRPALGPALFAFCFTLAVLLFVWQRSAALVRSAVRLALVLPADGSSARGEVAPPGAGLRPGRRRGVAATSRLGDELVTAAVLDAVLLTALVVAACDLGAGRAAGALHAAARLMLAVAAGGAALGLVAWAGRMQVLRRAEAEEAGVQPGFSRLWWWAVVPAVAACLLVGLALPRYGAPLQGPALGGLVVGFVELVTGATGTRPAAGLSPTPGGGITVVLAAGCLALILLLAWPLRAAVERTILGGRRPDDAAAPPLGLGLRLRLWWERLRQSWGKRSPARGRPSGTWRLLPPPPERRAAVPPPEAPPPPSGDARLRVRAAYGRVLRDAAATGVGRRAHESPRGFLAAILRRAAEARLPLEGLTALYEVARFSRRPLEPGAAERAEADARAAAYGLHIAQGERRRRSGGQPAPDPALRWTAPRGMRGRRW